MSFILAMMVRNEAKMLSLTLPVIAPFLPIKVALDTGSTDGTQEVLRRHGFEIRSMNWNNNFSEARNILYAIASEGCSSNDWVLMLDADEAMWPEDIETLAMIAKQSKRDLITLPRYNFSIDTSRVNLTNYPDKQARVLRCGAALEFRNPVHEVVFERGASANVVGFGLDEFASKLHIYHYGGCKHHADVWRRSHNYQQIAKGEPTLDDAPEWVYAIKREDYIDEVLSNLSIVRFADRHPLEGIL